MSKAWCIVVWAVVVMVGITPCVVWAGDTDSPAGPADPASAMPTLEDVYQRLLVGADYTLRTTFSEPVAGPGATGHTLQELMDAAPVADASDGAEPGDVGAGKTFWGLRAGGGWGPQTGTLAVQSIDGNSTSQAAGIYAAFDLALVDTDLASGNVRSGVTVFGVAGDTNVVDTSSGDAVAAEILTGKVAWVDGAEVTGARSPALVGETGQVTCYDAAGAVISCAGTGQDGDLLPGVAWPNPRFTDNSDGTVTDNLTGLIWLKDASCADLAGTDTNGAGNWTTALTASAALASGTCGLIDSSVAGDWRLPSRFELESLLDLEYYNPALSNAAGTGKWVEGDAFSGVQSNFYWSSTSYAINPPYAWIVHLSDGHVDPSGKANALYVWPVRGGQ